MIHGGKDAYIGPAIAERLFDLAQPPKEKWIVPGAKHNRCREVRPEEYAARLLSFLDRFAPRRALPAAAEPATAASAWRGPVDSSAPLALGNEVEPVVAAPAASEVAGPLSG
jgi:hypothetical protein